MESHVYRRPDLLRLGLTDATIRRLVRHGDLTRLRAGWYASTGADPAVLEAVGRGGVLSCVSALRLHGIWIPPGHDSLHVRASKHGIPGRRDFCRTPGRPLPTLSAVDPIPTALVAAAQCMSEEQWIIACDSVLNSTGTPVDSLAEQLPQMSARIRGMLAKCDGRSQSGTETAVRLRLRARGFHVEVQPQIPEVGRADLRVGRLLIECDSRLHHTRQSNYRTDRFRDRKSLALGYLTMRLTYDDVLYGWPEALADITAITGADRHRPSRRRSA